MTAHSPKRLLFRLTKPPYGTSYAKEALDAILAAAAFEQEVSILFCGDAIYQLLEGQQPDCIQQKNFSAAFGLFPIYGLTELFVDAAALHERNLQSTQLLLPVRALDKSGIRDLLRRQNQIISF